MPEPANRRSSGRIRGRIAGDARPWAGIPTRLRDALRPALPTAIAAVVEAVETEVPLYRADTQDPVHRGLLAGVQVALGRLLELLGRDEPALIGAAELYQKIGELEYRSARPLEDVLSAYRVGATTTWRVFSGAALESGASPEEVATLAQACFAYINEIAAASTAGYARAQASDAGARSRVRTELLTAILSGRAETAEAVELARRAGWSIPGIVTVALLPDDAGDGVLARLNDSGVFLAAETADGAAALAPHPLGEPETALFERIVAGIAVEVGTVQPVVAAAASAGHARALAANRNLWGLPNDALVRAQDHLPELLLSSDPGLGELLRQGVLAPLLALPPERGEPLLATLRLWLLLHGSRQRVADVMTVHPQTVSYRMERIRTLLGDALADPYRSWAIQVALMSRSPLG